MAEWMEKTLGELTSYMTKGIPPKYADKEGANTIWVLNQKCNRNFEISYAEARLHDIGQKKVPEDKLLKDGDVLINSTGTGTAGRVAQMSSVAVPTTMDGHMILLRPTDEIDAVYYGYAIKLFQSQIECLAEGSTGQTEIDRKRLQDEVVIKFPADKAIQRRIGSFLANLDEKIKTNTQMNQNLEQQAQTIFQEWFINSPDNSQWKMGTFSELIQSTLNGDWGKEFSSGQSTEKVYCIRGADIPAVKAGNKGKCQSDSSLPRIMPTKSWLMEILLLKFQEAVPHSQQADAQLSHNPF